MVGKVGRGVSDVCFDGVNKTIIEQLLYAGSRAQHFSSINSFLLLNDAEVRTWSPYFTEEVNETLEAQVACQGHSRWWSWSWGPLSRPQLFLTLSDRPMFCRLVLVPLLGVGVVWVAAIPASFLGPPGPSQHWLVPQEAVQGSGSCQVSRGEPAASPCQGKLGCYPVSAWPLEWSR